ncbi:GerAB/ArcD/ProY family transporter [Paenibacillus sp. LHD-117]|uniref:GerAB/ArcD/ProY family transporter n=1 Tax=Paenibacillus sp. LHD-117 TaxID=3071412 RepID=UPI0027DF799D|nr:GerAB/ArcD/ProY family transporter [Paenibacillus sp. LHD-117]MDQ6418797.1 GerAB/ArcD/ProY family transporter [Paenibacillus sp. LHD-117]
MTVKEKINGRQLAIIAAYLTLGDSMLILPPIPVHEAKKNAWISSLLGLAAGLLVILLLCAVGKLYPLLTMVEIQEKLFGKWLGIAVSLFFLFYLFSSVSAHVREIGNFMTTQMLPETPLLALLILYGGIIVLAVRFAARNLYATFAMAKKIDIGQFLQRIEVILAFMWLLTTYFKTAIYFYAFHVAFAQVFRLRDYKGLTLPFGMLMVFYAIIVSPNVVHINNFVTFWPYFDFTFSVVVPLLLLAAYAVRRGFAGNKGESGHG